MVQVSKSLVEQQLDWIIVIFNTCKAKFVVDALEYPSHLYYPLEFSTGSLRMVSVGNNQGHNYYYAGKSQSEDVNMLKCHSTAVPTATPQLLLI